MIGIASIFLIQLQQFIDTQNLRKNILSQLVSWRSKLIDNSPSSARVNFTHRYVFTHLFTDFDLSLKLQTDGKSLFPFKHFVILFVATQDRQSRRVIGHEVMEKIAADDYNGRLGIQVRDIKTNIYSEFKLSGYEKESMGGSNYLMFNLNAQYH